MIFLARFLLVFGCFGLFLLSVGHAQGDEKTVVIEGRHADGPFTEERPASMCFKEVRVSREGSQRIKFELTMAGPLPTGIDLEKGYYFCFDFDVDDSASTGSVDLNSSGFGSDMHFWIRKFKEEGRFETDSEPFLVQGKKREFALTGLKVRGNTVEVTVRSEVFRIFDTLKFNVSTMVIIYQKGKRLSKTTVDSTSIQKL